jgi:hypothetical protein
MHSSPSSRSSLRLVAGLSVALFGPFACGESANSGGGGSVNVPPTEPTPPACNGDQPDGYCNIEGVDNPGTPGNPEQCSCFDCVDSAFCTSLCADDGTCTEQELTVGGCFCDDCKEACMMGSGGSPGVGAGGPGGAGGTGATGAAGGAGGTGAAGGAGGTGATGAGAAGAAGGAGGTGAAGGAGGAGGV